MNMMTSNIEFSNAIHVVCQMIAITLWMGLLVHLYYKKDYLKKHTFWLISFAVCSTMLSLLSELVQNHFLLTWNLWHWYPTNYALIFSFYCLINELERVIDKNLE